MREENPAPQPENSNATPALPRSGGADDIDFVDAGGDAGWAHDGAGYPPEAGLEGVGYAGATDSEPEADTDPETALAFAGGDKGESESDGPGIWAGMGSHLDELRRRIVYSLAVFIPMFGVGLYLYQYLWRVIIFPLDRSAPHLLRFQALSPSDGLVMAMRIAFAFALFMSLPVWLSQIWFFVAPGLTGRERRWLYIALGSGTCLFAIGAALAYFFGVPFALEYLLPFNQSLEGWENSFTGTGYVDFVVTCCTGFGIAFELPLVMLTLGWMGLITPDGLRRWWKVVILVVFIVAAVMTPPDPFTQMMLAVPMLGLFWLGYWLVKWTYRKKEAGGD